MTTLLFTHSACLEHSAGPFHPESPDRLRAVLDALERIPGLASGESGLAEPATVGVAHDPRYVERLLAAVPTAGYVPLDPDTALSPGSGRAALAAAGAVTAAVDAVLDGQAANAFCAVRPPGHHAETARGMGFCLFNNAAIAAQYARKIREIPRAAVVDFDVHHGNGTEQILRADAGSFFASSHQSPAFPGTGDRFERTTHLLNVPLAPGTDGKALRAAWEDHILPALDSFAPDIVVISAGFDGHAVDPLASWNLVEDDFRWVTREIARVAAARAGGRIVSVLEGGYDLPALAASATAHVEALISAGA